MTSRKQKTIGWIRAIRPQFLFAYVVLGLGGLFIGLALFRSLASILYAVLSFTTIILATIGINFRDEAADWLDGFDKEYGGAGVIREGILEVKPLQFWGRLLNVIAIGIAIVQTFFIPPLIYVLIPIGFVIIGSNYLTERIFLGHEIFPAFSFTMTFLWVYLGQGWPFTTGILYFTLFAFMLVFALVPFQDIGDYEADKKSGKKTLTVKLGLDKVGLFSIFIALLSLFLLFAAIYAFLNP